MLDSALVERPQHDLDHCLPRNNRLDLAVLRQLLAFARKVVVLVEGQRCSLAQVLLKLDESLLRTELDSLIEGAAEPDRQLDVAQLLALRFRFNFLFI